MNKILEFMFGEPLLLEVYVEHVHHSSFNGIQLILYALAFDSLTDV